MLTLRDYLDLTVEGARNQWLSLEKRAMPEPGRDQVDYSPIETLTCFGLGLVSPPSRSGTINLRESDATVQRLASLFRRTPKSLAAKLSNLNGRRSHRARYEVELWVHLTGSDFTFPALYATMLHAAREAGLNDHSVPDYLGLGSERLQLVLNSIDVSDADLEQSVAEQISLRGEHIDPLTERAMVGTARIGQQQFARRVLGNSEFSCAFCGLSAQKHGIRPSRLLVASHIKPWRDSTNKERLDATNGIAACPTHDAAFENHLIGIDRAGRIIRAAAVDHAVAQDISWERAFGNDTLAERLLVAPGRSLPGQQFVDWHWSSRPLDVELSYDR